MHKTLLIAAATIIFAAGAAGAAYAQTAPDETAPTTKHHTHHSHHKSTGEKPIDKGPTTPDANAAYQGGGVVLQGAPGAPAPTPQATPPGQAPAGAVPH